MSLAVRALTVLITLAGVAAPIIAFVASGIIASTSPELGRGKITQGIKLCTTLNIVSIACSLSLILLIPMPLAQWACATVIALVFGVIGCAINLVNAVERLKASVKNEGATVHQISDARSANSN